MEMKTARQVGFFTSVLLVVGCGGGGTLSLPGGGYCNGDLDCNSGFICMESTSYDYKTCQLLVKPTECPSGHDGGEVDAGEIPDAGAPDSGGEVIDAGKPDSGLPDSGTPEEDAGLPDDAGNVPDSGEPVVDAGDEPDAGGSEPDAGPVPDAGTELDAGEIPDAGTPTVDAGITPDAGATPDAGTVEVAFAFDRKDPYLVGDDVYVFAWDTNYPATGELFLGAVRVEFETGSLRYNHVLTHRFSPGTYPYKIVTSKETTSLFFTGSVTVAPKPDLTAPVVVIAHGPVTETSTYIALSASEQLADQQLSCGPDAQHMTARPSGLVGESTIPLNGLSAGTTYTCQLSVHDASPARNAAVSPYETFTTLTPTVDQTPPFIAVFATQLSPDLPVTLSWVSDKPLAAGVVYEYGSGTVRYRVENQPGGMTGSTMIPAAGQPALPPLTNYTFTVTGTKLSNAVVGVGPGGTFTTLPANPPMFWTQTSLPLATHPSTSIDLNWWSTKMLKAAQVKCGTSSTSLTMTPVVITTGLPASSGKVSLVGYNPTTTYFCQLVGTDLYDNVNASDLFTFTTWHIATGKFVHTFDRSSGATTTFLFWESTDYSTNGPEVLLTVQQEFSSSAVNRNPYEKMHITTDAPIGGAITQPGQAARVYWPSGAPFLFNGSPIPPLTTDPNYRGRGVVNPTADDRKVVGL